MHDHHTLGQRFPRFDSTSKVTGTALFAADVFFPNMLYARILRSPYAHARIKRLDITPALGLEGVKSVITADDFPPSTMDKKKMIPGTPLLQKRKVVFAGAPIAAVAAIDHRTAEKALTEIIVEYEELEPVIEITEALLPGAPIIHDNLFTEIKTNNVSGKGVNDAIQWADKPSNLAYYKEYTIGNQKQGFADADVILENTFTTQRVHQGYLETRSAIAAVDIDGRITVWTDNQGIFRVRDNVAAQLGLPLTDVNVMPVEIGGAFGAKSLQPLSPICALLARKTGCPVKMVMTRAEDLISTFPAPASKITLKMGVTKDGLLTAVEGTFIFDSGAFLTRSHAQPPSITGLGLYRIPNRTIKCYDVVTNKAPSGYYRAPSAAQGAFAVESQMDLLARELDMDPLAFRMKNAVNEGDTLPDGTKLPQIGFREVLKKVSEKLKDKPKPKGSNQGRGIACGFWRGGVGCSSAEVRINSDGTVVLLVGVTDLTGSRTSLAQLVAEEFCLPYQRVRVVSGSTDTAPHSDITAGSRTMHQLGTAVVRACQDAKAQLRTVASSYLKVHPQSVEWYNGEFYVKNRKNRSVTVAELARESVTKEGLGPVIGSGSVGKPFSPPLYAVHVADIEVDKETGKVKILSYLAAQDVGCAINPLSIEGQIQGAVTQGIGWALHEYYDFKNGIMQNPSLLDYRLPTVLDVPKIEPLLVEVASPTGPYGIRGVGEPPIVPSLATLANAVQDATGLRLFQLPMTPEANCRAEKVSNR